MKKAILTIGLFSMMLVLTSFTSQADIGGQGAPRSGDKITRIGFEIGGQGAPRSGDIKPQPVGNKSATIEFEIGGQGAPRSGDIKPQP